MKDLKSTVSEYVSRLRSIDKKMLLVVTGAFLLGVVWLTAMRFVLYTKTEVHYHANFGVFVNDTRLPFDSFTFYEEVQSCGGDEVNNPKTRVHMHDQKNHVLHVHDAAATWGHFFTNIGMTLGDTVFKTDTSTFVEDDVTEIRYYLNGEEVETTANRTIESEDVLLVSIGEGLDETKLQDQYSQIERDASVYNQQNDPSSCSGGKPLGVRERLKIAVQFWR